MKQQEFLMLLNAPFSSGEKELDQVKEIIEEFPYFQTARLLYAKLLKESQSIHFDSQLKIAAAYATDRTQLFNLIERSEREKSFTPEKNIELKTEEPVSSAEKTIPEEEIQAEIISEKEEVKTSQLSPEEIIQKRLEEIEKEKTPPNKIKEELIEPISEQPEYKIEDYFPPETSSQISIKEKEKQEVEISRERKEDTAAIETEIKTPADLKSHISETHSFLEWLSYSKTHLKKPEEEERELLTEKSSSFEKAGEKKTDDINTLEPSFEKEEPKIPAEQIIEKFIKEDPRISPAKPGFFSPANMARQSIEEHDDLVSPTLAQIYLMQGNVQKAIETYDKLILLYPEKSAFFATQIEKIKKSF